MEGLLSTRPTASSFHRNYPYQDSNFKIFSNTSCCFKPFPATLNSFQLFTVVLAISSHFKSCQAMFIKFCPFYLFTAIYTHLLQFTTNFVCRTASVEYGSTNDLTICQSNSICVLSDLLPSIFSGSIVTFVLVHIPEM